MRKKIRLGVNIDHVTTLRNARRKLSSIIDVANLLSKCDVDLITVHLREDRRHIVDNDLYELKKKNFLPLNLEMASTQEMKKICIEVLQIIVVLYQKKRETNNRGWA